jgi:hypothetical protein
METPPPPPDPVYESGRYSMHFSPPGDWDRSDVHDAAPELEQLRRTPPRVPPVPVVAAPGDDDDAEEIDLDSALEDLDVDLGSDEPAPPPPPVLPAQVIDDEPSNFTARPNPYRALAGLLLLVVVGLGGLVYYLLNREPEATESHEPSAPVVISGAAPDASGTGDEPSAPSPEKKDDDKEDDDKKDDEPKKKHKPDDDDKPHKKSSPQQLVQSTDEERKEFFGALASDVRRCASQHEAAKELVRVAVNVEAGSGKLDASLRSHKDNGPFGDCVVKAFEKRRFKKGKQAFVYNSDYQI